MQVTRFDLNQLVRHYGSKDIRSIVKHIEEFRGPSYILDLWNLKAQVKKPKCTGYHLLNYIVLASFRSYESFLNSGDNTLLVDFCPLTKQDIVNNPYINRYGNKIHFLLEPDPAELKRKQLKRD